MIYIDYFMLIKLKDTKIKFGKFTEEDGNIIPPATSGKETR